MRMKNEPRHNNSDLSEFLCGQIDWDRPELKSTTAAKASRAGDFEKAAIEFIRHLRSRQRPLLGYSKEWVAALRANATDEFCRQAETTVENLLEQSFQTGDHPDGRGTFLAARPEVLQIGATCDDFERYAELVAQGRDMWLDSRIHTIVNILRFLQSVWPLDECPDKCLLPLFAFLTTALPKEWEWTRRWGETMLGSSGHNWWICQHGGLWKAGFLFPEFKGFEQFQAFFPTYFEREMSLLFHGDGFTRECSVSYHIGTVDLFLDAVRMAQLNDLRFSSEFNQRLHAAAEAEWKLMRPDGNFPAFGDAHAEGPYVIKRLRSNAAIHGMPEAKYLAETLFADECFPFGEMMVETLHYPSVGEDLRPAYDRLEPKPPTDLDTALVESGYYAMRQDWSASADFAAIEASTRGYLTSSHGQSAIFDLHLSSRGRAITVGNGKGPEVSDMNNRDRTWRISNYAHSTATVDGQDHVPIRSIYRFDRTVVPTVDAWRSEPEFAYFSGAHEAYERLEKKVPGSRRKLFYLRGDYWILLDRFTAASPDDAHTYEQHFQVDVQVSRAESGSAITEGEGGNLIFLPVDGARGETSLEPCPQPLEGYPSPNQLCFTQKTEGNALFVTLLVPFEGREIPDVECRLLEVNSDGRALSSWEATGLEILFQGRLDVYVDLHMHWNLPWECGGYRSASRLFHSRGSCSVP